MASTLLRTSTLRGSAFRRVLSAAAAAAPSGGEGLAARRAAPLRRLLHSGAPGDQPPTSLDEKVNLLHQSINELDMKVEKRFLIFASLQKLVEEKKLLNPFIQWSWQVGVVALIVFAERWMGSDRENN
ncbi:uncharacterized protein LOC133920629 [Phragmites australis]|uniref:uncharacterized protein LOC133920629 n=1 Tax=Phragmites australis TaxID=29695 RepID=UPI002D787209|nr:uncharacterized protein LOC133920629 [Phragmites australis]